MTKPKNLNKNITNSGWAKAFALDLRSLALMRMALGVVTLAFSIKLLFFFHYFAPANGFVPISNLATYTGRWSFHFAITAAWWQYFLIILTAISGFCLMIGYQARFFGFAVWLLVLSSFVRYKSIFNTGQKLIFYTAIWTTVLPVAKVWAIDAISHENKALIRAKETWKEKVKSLRTHFWFISPKKPLNYLSFGTFGYLIQIALMFWVSIYFKEGNMDWKDGTAVYKALHHDVYASWIAPYVRELFDGRHTYIATYGAVFAEFFGPLFLFIPFWTQRFRAIGFFTFSRNRSNLRHSF